MKYFVVIEGIDPATERPLVGHSATREGAEEWATAHLKSLEDTPRYVNAEAVIYWNVPQEVKRIKRQGKQEATLEEKVVAIVEEIGMSITKNGETPLTPVEIGAKLQLALEKVKGKS